MLLMFLDRAWWHWKSKTMIQEIFWLGYLHAYDKNNKFGLYVHKIISLFIAVEKVSLHSGVTGIFFTIRELNFSVMDLGTTRRYTTMLRLMYITSLKISFRCPIGDCLLRKPNWLMQECEISVVAGYAQFPGIFCNVYSLYGFWNCITRILRNFLGFPACYIWNLLHFCRFVKQARSIFGPIQWG